MIINTATQNWTKSRDWVFGTLNTRRDVPQDSGIYMEGEAKRFKESGVMDDSRRETATDTVLMFIWTHKDCDNTYTLICSSQMKGCTPRTYLRSCLQLTPSGRGRKYFFFIWNTIWYINHALCSEVVGSPKMDSNFGTWLFFCWFLIWGVLFCFLEEEHEVRWIRRSSNTLYEKKANRREILK